MKQFNYGRISTLSDRLFVRKFIRMVPKKQPVKISSILGIFNDHNWKIKSRCIYNEYVYPNGKTLMLAIQHWFWEPAFAKDQFFGGAFWRKAVGFDIIFFSCGLNWCQLRFSMRGGLVKWYSKWRVRNWELHFRDLKSNRKKGK